MMNTNHNQDRDTERIKVFNLNSTDLLFATIFLGSLKLDGHLDWSWLGVVAPLAAWWLFGKLLVLVFGIFLGSKHR
jgi:hypothetical protein